MKARSLVMISLLALLGCGGGGSDDDALSADSVTQRQRDSRAT